jgi:hypothetical protein
MHLYRGRRESTSCDARPLIAASTRKKTFQSIAAGHFCVRTAESIMCAGGTRRRVKVCALQTSAAYEPRKITRRLRSSTLIFGMNEIAHAASSLSAIISQRVKVICWVDSALSGAEQPPDALCHHEDVCRMRVQRLYITSYKRDVLIYRRISQRMQRKTRAHSVSSRTITLCRV